MSSVVSGGRSSVDALTTQAILHRETIVKNYLPIVQATNNLPMLKLRKDGECEVGDPRACIHHQNSAADLACALYVDVSRNYFNAMVGAGYIAQGLRVVLHCTECDEYDERIVVRAQDDEHPTNESVEDLINKFKNRQGTCRPGVEIIGLGGGGYEFREIKALKRGRTGGLLPGGGRFGRSTVRSAAAWRKKLAEDKTLHECQRRLVKEETVRNLSGSTSVAACRRDGAQDLSRVAVPTLIIHAAWCFPGHEQRRKMAYGYRA